MPYIKLSEKNEFDCNLVHIQPNSPGDLNYCITMLVLKWIGKNPNYEKYNAAMGVLECAKQELYRRAVSPYEDKKITENGDVYPTYNQGVTNEAPDPDFVSYIFDDDLSQFFSGRR